MTLLFQPALMFLGASGPAKIPLSMLMIFVSAKLLAEVFERLRQPGIVGEILAGVLIGPSVLGWLAPDEFLTALSDLGAMFLLFRVGLEVKASELMKVGGTATVVACSGVIVPFVMGWGILLRCGRAAQRSDLRGRVDGGHQRGHHGPGAVGQGTAARRPSHIILAAAVIDDVLGLLVLAVVSSLTRGHGATGWNWG